MTDKFGFLRVCVCMFVVQIPKIRNILTRISEAHKKNSYTRMEMGHRDAPSAFQSLMDEIMVGFLNFIFWFNITF